MGIKPASRRRGRRTATSQPAITTPEKTKAHKFASRSTPAVRRMTVATSTTGPVI
ncbi:MAG: hypothetical protein ACXWOV_05870 [Isosphaeraceae bacterium]|jgi:hypothetical protein